MTPPVHSFPAVDLPLQVQLDATGRVRKSENGQPISLTGCELLSLVQYDCSVDHPEIRNSPVRCWPVQRWFRRYEFWCSADGWLVKLKQRANSCCLSVCRCQDKKGSFTVETTAWEGSALASTTKPEESKPKQVEHWTPSGQDRKSIPRIESY